MLQLFFRFFRFFVYIVVCALFWRIKIKLKIKTKTKIFRVIANDLVLPGQKYHVIVTLLQTTWSNNIFFHSLIRICVTSYFELLWHCFLFVNFVWPAQTDRDSIQFRTYFYEHLFPPARCMASFFRLLFGYFWFKINFSKII